MDNLAAADLPLGALDHLLCRESNDGLLTAVAAAAVVHAVVFAITWPSLVRPKPEPPGELIRIPIVRIVRTPPQRILDPPRAPVQLVPIPDATPFDPEPIRDLRTDQIELDLGLSPDAVLVPVDVPAPPLEPTEPGPIRVGGSVTPPQVIHRVLPRYPEIARQAHAEGTVIVDTVIDANGAVTEISVLQGLPFSLTEAAVEAVRQWRFEPSTLNGRPVAVRYVLTVRFHLD